MRIVDCPARLTERPGFALLEVIVAIMILATAGLALLGLVNESLRSVAGVREAEARFREASGFLEAVALWTRNDLDRRLGSRGQGDWTLDIQRIDVSLYLVTLVDPQGRGPVLQTTLYRPETNHAPE